MRPVFKTARFQIHNPSRHKVAILTYAMEHYHLTLKKVLEALLSDSDLAAKITKADQKGRSKLDKAALSRIAYKAAPKGWCLAPLRDYLIGNVISMLLSHFGKELKGKNESNPPTLHSFDPLSAEDRDRAFADFTRTIDFPKKPQEIAEIEENTAVGRVNRAKRQEAIYSSRAAARAMRDLLRSDEVRPPTPIEFTRHDITRGFGLARKGDRLYLLIRVFSPGHRWYKQLVLEEGFIDHKTGESIGGRKFAGLVLPLEFGREYHQNEFLAFGKPQSAKLVLKQSDSGSTQFFVHVAFEFTVEPIETRTYLGIDRGAARIGSASVVDHGGDVVCKGIVLVGATFGEEMRQHARRIAQLQSEGRKIWRKQFRLRRRRADSVVGEYANLVIELALQHRSQIVLESIDNRSMARFLTMSQVQKLHGMLAYKAQRVGLPSPIDTPAAFTSQTCHVCGAKDRASRLSEEQFRCVRCAYEDNADDNASVVIALRGLHQVQQGGRFQKFASFSEWMAGRRRPEAMSTKAGE